MKTISKKLFDEVIDLSRKYWESGTAEPDVILLKHRMGIARQISQASGISEYSISDLVDSIVRGFAPDAENEDIYLVLRVLGWRVTDEEHPAN